MVESDIISQKFMGHMLTLASSRRQCCAVTVAGCEGETWRSFGLMSTVSAHFR